MRSIKCPPAVREAADKATTGVKWLISFKFAEKGNKTAYRLAGRDAFKNQLVKANIFEGGDVIDVRVEIPLKDVPAAVRDAVKKSYPDFEPKLAEAVGKTMDKTIYYRLQGTSKGLADVLIARPDGTKVLREAESQAK